MAAVILAALLGIFLFAVGVTMGIGLVLGVIYTIIRVVLK